MTNPDTQPNLLDLVEMTDAAEAMRWAADFAVTSDDGPSDDSINPGPISNLEALAICADDGGDGSSGSDVRIKTDIEQVGTTVYGLPLFHFRYVDGQERFEGVMAQDVLEVMPDAVSVGENGFYRVNYRKLGIAMRPV